MGLSNRKSLTQNNQESTVFTGKKYLLHFYFCGIYKLRYRWEGLQNLCTHARDKTPFRNIGNIVCEEIPLDLISCLCHFSGILQQSHVRVSSLLLLCCGIQEAVLQFDWLFENNSKHKLFLETCVIIRISLI